MTGSAPTPVFGFLSADLHNGASTLLWPAVVQEAKRLGVNLVCFPGGRLGGPLPEAGLRNRVYNLAGPGCLDAVITWASSLGGVVDTAHLEAFHQRFRDLPLVSLSHKLEGVPVIRIDAYSGMIALVTHLVEVHGFDRVAFVRGPAGHQSAQLRHQAYRDALKAHGLAPDPRLEVGPLPWDAGAEAVRNLIDDRGLIPGRDFQALAAASDLLALGAFRALKDRGYRIPQDVVLVGFNGTVESVLVQPHLTTVHLPFQDQGQAAVRLLLDQTRGLSGEADLDLATQLLVRDSCGCPSRSSLLAGAPAGATPTVPDPRGPGRRWLDRVAALGDFGPEALQAWFEPLGAALEGDLRDPSPRFRVLELLDKALEHSAVADGGGRSLEWTAWQDVLSLVRSTFRPGLPPDAATTLDDLVDQCRVRISAFVEQRSTARAWEEGQRAETLREVGRCLSEAWSVAELASALDRIVPRLSIPGAWLVLTEAPVGDPPVKPDQARLVWAWHGGHRIGLQGTGLGFPVTELVPVGLRPAETPWCLVVEPLYFQDRGVGYAVFQTGPLDGAVYEELRSDLSSALKGIFLVAEAGHARRSAEKADQIKTRLLANVSHELRTPLTQILGHLRAAAQEPGSGRPLEKIRSSAEHQLRLINDLLDLSRAEIDELDLTRELLDPAGLLRSVFEEFVPADQGSVRWALEVPDRLPFLMADPLRLKQVFLNLLSNAAKFTTQGTIELGARTEPPHVRFWVRDTGAGITEDLKGRIFQPFVTGDHGAGSIGLGLSIAHHLVTLHFGSLDVETSPGEGTTFHIRLPLPTLDDSAVTHRGTRQGVVVVLSQTGALPADLEPWVLREGLEVVPWGREGGPKLEGLVVRCFCWDMTGAQPRDWGLVRQLRHHSGLHQAPFLLYGHEGLTALVDKAGSPEAAEQSLRMAIEAAGPKTGSKPVYVVDDEQESRASAVRILESTLPGQPVRTFADGPSAWEAMAQEVPGLVILDFSMPGWDGAEVLDRIRADSRLRMVPVLLLSHKVFTPEDIQRLEKHAQVTLQSKGIWSAAETGEVVERLLSGVETPPVHTSALVKRALAYMARHHQKALSRWQVAEAVNVSEDYLSRVFSRELGVSPWDFLNRYRIHQACLLLTGTNESIRTIALKVGFHDQAYFSRVFRKTLALTPQEYRQGGGLSASTGS